MYLTLSAVLNALQNPVYRLNRGSIEGDGHLPNKQMKMQLNCTWSCCVIVKFRTVAIQVWLGSERGVSYSIFAVISMDLGRFAFWELRGFPEKMLQHAWSQRHKWTDFSGVADRRARITGIQVLACRIAIKLRFRFQRPAYNEQESLSAKYQDSQLLSPHQGTLKLPGVPAFYLMLG